MIYQGGQNICGVSIGVLCLDSGFPKPPGHIKNPSSLPFPVHYETVVGASVKDLLANPSPEFLVPFIKAAQHLERQGARAITGSCGFLAIFQQELSDAVNIPVFASSLIQIPLAYNITGRKGPVGVLTASRESLTDRHFEAVGAAGISVAVQGMEHQPEFTEVILQGKRNAMDLDKIAAEVLESATELARKNPDMRVLVLECTDMPPYAHILQKHLKMPIFDLTTLTTMVHDTVTRAPYPGFMPYE